MAASYIPLIGLGNIISITEATGGLVAYEPGTIGTPAVTPIGRSGSVHTSILLALDNATADNLIPFAAAANLAIIKVRCPSGFTAPTDLASTTFDYSKLLAGTNADLLVSGFDVTALAWPGSLSSFFGFSTSPPNLANLFMKLTSAEVPSAGNPYGTLTYTLSGKAVTANVLSPLIRVDINFGSSISS